MKNDVKIGILIGTVLVIGIVLIISLWPGQSVDQRHHDMFQEQEVDMPISIDKEQSPPKKTPPPNKTSAKNIETPPPATPPRIHTVTAGETLSSIAMKYYGTTSRTKIISDANRHVINDKNQIRPTMRLIIPYTE